MSLKCFQELMHESFFTIEDMHFNKREKNLGPLHTMPSKSRGCGSDDPNFVESPKKWAIKRQ